MQEQKPNDPDLLTELEHKALRQTVELFNTLSKIVGDHVVAKPQDMREITSHIHDIQRLIMAQAACRAYPDQYRLLGEALPR